MLLPDRYLVGGWNELLGEKLLTPIADRFLDFALEHAGQERQLAGHDDLAVGDSQITGDIEASGYEAERSTIVVPFLVETADLVGVVSLDVVEQPPCPFECLGLSKLVIDGH